LSKIKNIIFDLDGTLIDSSDGVVEAVNYSLEAMGESKLPPEKIKPYIGYPLSEMYPDFTEKPFKELYKHFQVKAAETVVASSVLLPDVKEMLEKLAKTDYNLSIATTKIKEHLKGVIEKFGWHDLFTVYAGGNEVEHVKPAPDIFEFVMEKIKAKPKETIVVGDTENDIIAAQAIPIKVIAVKSPYDDSGKILKLAPDYYLESIKNLPDLLETISK
jgi:HAD superfamily hydrolase (TIGR01509 family)